MKHSDLPMANRALVTGLTGFTGRYVAQSLEAAGYEVWGTVSIGTAARRRASLARYQTVEADLLDIDSLRSAVEQSRPDVVVHLAACAHVANNDPRDLYLVNVVGTRNLLTALVDTKTKPHCVLLASSANVYGNVSVESIDEGVAPQPTNDYAVSKLAMEHAVRQWYDKLPIVIARPFNYTGVGQLDTYLLPKLVSHFANREPRISLGNLDVSRDFSDVRDIAAAYTRLVETAPAGEIFNVCSEHAYSLKDVIAMLSQIAGYVIDVNIDPRFVRENEVKKLVGSRGKLRAWFDDLPVTSFDDTLRWMVDALKPRALQGEFISQAAGLP
ncbi:NAD-dependent epimerase/dehydratase family protein [Burkholderia gladioli]|uniref:NAD-dependent epimerase/dehydratase family protein n=1 Tax=Burkholderia gladioli TaxID=28095 RepID=UPI0022D90B31|nr:NAD-dependent epimerase/dehydratase family protein [Burkholderia gladioli]MDA0570547.1 GDP-mannose 4,6-dehydratase [Burkholderia gladioli]MDA0598392.1 GDP-mannose 4,6-dehydratase [Burkholderia gladioli]